MDCPRIEMVHALHDGELSADKRAEVSAHVAACSACSAELQRFQRTGRFLKAGAAAALTGSGIMRLRNRLSAEILARANGRRIVRLAGWLTAAAAAVMVYCSAALYTIQEKPPAATAQVGIDVPLTPELPAESDDVLTAVPLSFDVKDDGRD